MRWLIALLLLAPQDVKMQAKFVVGEKTTITVESAVDMEIAVRDGEGETTRLLSVARKEKFSQEVTQVAGGMPAALTLRCVTSTQQKSGTNIALGTEVTPLVGRTFVGTRSAQGWVVKDQDGSVPPAGGQALGAWNEYVRLLPKEAVKANDSWKVEGSDLSDLLFPPGTSNVAGALDCSLESFGGGKATILVKGSVEGRGKDDSLTILRLAGSRLVFDTRSGKPLSLTLNGSLESKRDVVELIRKPGSSEDERRKVGEIQAKSRKLEISFLFE